jgi:putative oxidoreductase
VQRGVRYLASDVRRLFSTFAPGAPGGGLLLLRVVAGIALVFHAAMALGGNPPLGSTMLEVFSGAMGMLLLVGLWTPIAGSLLAILASCTLFRHPADLLNWILLGTLGASLALLGPGAWSVDAYLFGWKRIELPDRKS